MFVETVIADQVGYCFYCRWHLGGFGDPLGSTCAGTLMLRYRELIQTMPSGEQCREHGRLVQSRSTTDRHVRSGGSVLFTDRSRTAVEREG
jgi:hypothetical protein